MYAPTTARGKVPEYPRILPQIDVDDIPICEDTIVFESSTHDADYEAEERAKKRQKRRRDVAETYMRGGEVRILTASLRGPFERWQNPWAKGWQRIKQKGMVEVPETSAREVTNGPRASMQDVQMDESHGDCLNINDNEVTPFKSKLHKLEPLSPFDVKNQPNKVGLSGKEPSSTKRVEDWLKTNGIYARGSMSHAGSSPTPAARPPSRHQPPLPSVGSPLQPKHSGGEAARPRSPVPREAKNNTPSSPPGTASPAPTHESPQRAEAAILEHKKQSVHKLPPSTNLPAFEYRRGRREEKTRTDEGLITALEVSTEASKATAPTMKAPEERANNNEVLGPAQSKSEEKLTSRPGLSTETSRASTIHNLPSAQVAPVPLGPVASNEQSTNDLLQELPSTTRTAAQNDQTAPAKDVLMAIKPQTDVPMLPCDENKQLQKGKAIRVLAAAIPEPTLNQTPAREPETQEMLAAIKPFDFSTIKKPNLDFIRFPTPTTATKLRPSKPQKRASFAIEQPLSDDSQKSLKTTLKVKKVMVPVMVEKTTSKVALCDEASPEVDAAPENAHLGSRDGTLPSLSSMFGEKKASAPKSILKSSNAMSSTPLPSHATTSMSTKQNAQIPSGQAKQLEIQVDGMGQDDSFDLDAAIDDLGSYLGTWDADEEATRLTATK